MGLACVGILPESRSFAAPRDGGEAPVARAGDGKGRADALARAKVWEEPRRGAGVLGTTPGGPRAIKLDEPVSCRFEPDGVGGSTPKFDCRFGDEVLKVKYASPEVHTEAAATRLLSALGFGADRVYVVRTLRCFGCPEDPFVMLSCLSNPVREFRDACRVRYGRVSAAGAFELTIDYGSHVDFGPVAIERRWEGEEIRDGGREGWGFDELDLAQSQGRGDTRAHRDALRLLAVFLNNWDTRPDNQGLLCRDSGEDDDGPCRKPFAYMRDVGATFGAVGGESKAARKLDVEGWSQAPIWKDAALCTVAIQSPRLHGASFGEAVVSEAGRRFLAGRLKALSKRQVQALFEGALFTSYPDSSPSGRELGAWVKAFEDKVRQIVQRPPCPTP